MLQINNNTGPPFCKLYLWQFNCQLIYKLLKIHVFRSPRTSWNKPLVRNSTEIDFVTQVTLIQNSVYDGRNALQKCMMAEMLFENDGSNTLNKYIIPTKSKKPRVKNTKRQQVWGSLFHKNLGLYWVPISDKEILNTQVPFSFLLSASATCSLTMGKTIGTFNLRNRDPIFNEIGTKKGPWATKIGNQNHNQRDQYRIIRSRPQVLQDQG